MAPARTAPLRAEASTVSLPPRERIPAKRRARAIQHGQPMPDPTTNSVRRKAKAPEPTLAATRQRRAVAMDVAYLSQADGIHIKQVRRRASPAPAPPIPYLSDQDDIPRSDMDSDDGSDDGSDGGTIATVLDVGLSMNAPDFDIDVDMDTRAPPVELDETDYDAEGEDDDEVMRSRDNAGPSSVANHTFGAAWDHTQPTSTPQMWPGISAQPNNLIGSASEEDVRALFGGLDNFPASLSTNFPSGFPTVNTANSLLGADMQGLGAFGMHKLHTAVDNLQTFSPQLSTQPPVPLDPFVHHLPHITPSRAPTPASIPSPFARPSPHAPPSPLHYPSLLCHPSPLSHPLPPLCPLSLSRHATQAVPASRTGTPIGIPVLSRSAAPACQTPRSSTQDLVAQARSQAQLSAPAPPRRPLPIPGVDVPAGPLLRLPPLRKSLRLPSFLGGDEDGNSSSDEDLPRPPTPVALEDTDIGLNEFSPAPVTQARARAIRYSNVHLLPRHASSNPRIPTVLELRTDAARVFRLTRQRNRKRNATTAESARTRNTLSSAELTSEQRLVISQLEYRVLWGVVTDIAWPELEKRDLYLADARAYATEVTGVSDDGVFSQRLLDTVLYRMSANRSNPLAKVMYMMEEKFRIQEGDKSVIYQLMDKDLFLYSSIDRDPHDYFFVEALGGTLEIILFKSSKQIGRAFMEEMCKPDDAERCAHWHRQLRDQTARKGVPPGLLALAATQMYWALERLYMGSKLSFDEQHYRAVWNRYFRALIKLPRLGRLRVDMLDRLKEYYIIHWPVSEEADDDDDSLPAW